MYIRAVARSEIPEELVVMGGHNVSPLVEIGLTDPPKSGGADTPPASHLAACLYLDPLGAIVCLDSL